MDQQLTSFCIRHALLTQDELDRLAREFPEMALLRAAIETELLSEAVAQDVEAVCSDPESEALATRIPGILLLSVIGKGARGTVYRAWQEGLRRVVAVKTLPREFLQTKEERGRFIREARIAARLSHPALMRAYDIGSVTDFVYIVLEYVEGESLQQLLRREKTLTALQTVEFALGIAEGLAFAAANGIAHRDIKPANVQILPDGNVKILDLGLARPAGESDLTQPLKVHGTPAYVAPEQARGATDLTPQVDIYALGVLMFRCVTGRHLFQAADANGMLLAHIEQEAPSVDSLVKGLPDDLVELIAMTLRKRPTKRPDASTVVGHLRKIRDTIAQPTPASGRQARQSRPTSRESKSVSAQVPSAASNTPSSGGSRRRLLLSFVVIVLLMAALVAALALRPEDNAQELEDLKNEKAELEQRASALDELVRFEKDHAAVKELADRLPPANSGPVEEALKRDLERNKHYLDGDGANDRD